MCSSFAQTVRILSYNRLLQSIFNFYKSKNKKEGELDALRNAEE